MIVVFRVCKVNVLCAQLIRPLGIESIKLNLIRSNKDVTNTQSKFYSFKIKMSHELQLANFERPFSSNFDFKRNDFAHKFQEYPCSKLI